MIDCIETFEAIKENFDIRIFESGEIMKIIPTKNKQVRSFADGIMDLFLLSVHLHEGGENDETVDCKFEEFQSKEFKQLIKVGNATFVTSIHI